MALPHGGNVYHYSGKYGIPLSKLIDFSASINPLGPPRAAMKALVDAMPGITNYPDPGSSILRSALSLHHGIAESSVIVGSGSTEFIYLLPRALGARSALVLSPGFSDYERAAKNAGCAVRHLPLKERDNFVPDLPGLKAALKGIGLLFLCNPNNPTGVLLDKNTVLEIIGSAKASGAFVCVDEAFIEYCPGASVIREAAVTGGVAVLRNFTKFYGMPGLRLGYLTASPALIKKIEAAKEPWTVNSLAQGAAVAALSDKNFEKNSLRLAEKERAYLAGELAAMPGFKTFPSSANFILVRLPEGLSADGLAERTASRGILIRSCSNFRGLGDGFIRVAVRTRRENEALMEAFKSFTTG